MTADLVASLRQIADGKHLPDRGAKRGSAPAESAREEFGALPSCAAPRWLVPCRGAAGVRGLDIYTPYTQRAKMLKWAVAAGLRLGLGFPTGRSVSLASRLEPLDCLVAAATGENHPYYAFAMGGPGPYAKLTVQAMRRSGEVLGFLKLPMQEAGAGRVRNEASMLRLWADTQALEGRVPRLLYSGDWLGTYLLFQTAASGTVGPKLMGRPHAEFLRRLREAAPAEGKPGERVVAEVFEKWWQRPPAAGPEWLATASAGLECARQLLSRKEVSCGLVHGDFAPWNTRIEGGELFVFDWESAAFGWPVDWDAMHFQVQVSCLLGGSLDGLPAAAPAMAANMGVFLLYLLASAANLLREGVSPAHVACRTRAAWVSRMVAACQGGRRISYAEVAG
jgi:hypothetical protein